MFASDAGPDRRGSEFDYLRVDSFIDTAVGARSLATAFEVGLIDHLLTAQPCTFADMGKALPIDAPGLEMLIGLLVGNAVAENRDGTIGLTPRFMDAMRHRDLLEVKAEFARFVLSDFMDLFTTLVRSPDQFMRQARTFGLFCYDRAFEPTEENVELTRRWMRITTTLTRYEAPACIAAHDFSRYRRMLDIGGNSGEFALQVCRLSPDIRATVFDLPVVCDIGRRHVGGEPEAGRISFVEGNALTDELPAGCDLVTFKSMLHDWPEAQAKRLLARATEALSPGGTLLIYERAALEPGRAKLPYSMIPLLLLFRWFRSPRLYVDVLTGLGYRDVTADRIDLETPFALVTATKTA